MAFSQLTQITQQQYQSLNPAFGKPPVSSSSGSPDPRASIQLGGWVSDNVLAFQIVTAAAASTSLSIDTSVANTVDINIVAGTSPGSITTYWTVDTGSDSKATDWSIGFNVAANSRGTGTWTFTKGKSEDDDQY
jgi:hypothetical protein